MAKKVHPDIQLFKNKYELTFTNKPRISKIAASKLKQCKDTYYGSKSKREYYKPTDILTLIVDPRTYPYTINKYLGLLSGLDDTNLDTYVDTILTSISSDHKHLYEKILTFKNKIEPELYSSLDVNKEERLRIFKDILKDISDKLNDINVKIIFKFPEGIEIIDKSNYDNTKPLSFLYIKLNDQGSIDVDILLFKYKKNKSIPDTDLMSLALIPKPKKKIVPTAASTSTETTEAVIPTATATATATAAAATAAAATAATEMTEEVAPPPVVEAAVPQPEAQAEVEKAEVEEEEVEVEETEAQAELEKAEVEEEEAEAEAEVEAEVEAEAADVEAEADTDDQAKPDDNTAYTYNPDDINQELHTITITKDGETKNKEGFYLIGNVYGYEEKYENIYEKVEGTTTYKLSGRFNNKEKTILWFDIMI